MYESFYREELQLIRERAISHSRVDGLNLSWKRAYEDLANAADHLDAMEARCEVTLCDDEENNA